MIRGEEKESIRSLLGEGGAVAVGFARAAVIDKNVTDVFSRWIEEGNHAGMDYLERHVSLKADPENVLTGVRTIISLAFSYVPPVKREVSLPMIALYAYGEDYHDVIRKRLKNPLAKLKERFGGDWRVCIDSAPMAERYWALKSGIGAKGKNGSVIVKNGGSLCFLAEILTTIEILPDAPSFESCLKCDECIKACPTGALKEDGRIDSRKCLSYLSIEHKGEWNIGQKDVVRKSGVNIIFGCDACVSVCPHNSGAVATEIEEFHLSETLAHITEEKIEKYDNQTFLSSFGKSPLKRAGLEGLKRNISQNVKK